MMTKTIIFDYDGTIRKHLESMNRHFVKPIQWLTEQKVTEERR